MSSIKAYTTPSDFIEELHKPNSFDGYELAMNEKGELVRVPEREYEKFCREQKENFAKNTGNILAAIPFVRYLPYNWKRHCMEIMNKQVPSIEYSYVGGMDEADRVDSCLLHLTHLPTTTEFYKIVFTKALLRTEKHLPRDPTELNKKMVTHRIKSILNSSHFQKIIKFPFFGTIFRTYETAQKQLIQITPSRENIKNIQNIFDDRIIEYKIKDLRKLLISFSVVLGAYCLFLTGDLLKQYPTLEKISNLDILNRLFG